MLFNQLIQENLEVWDQYLHHPFVTQLKNQTLPYENFLFYLKQDYLYLIAYARCFALLGYKSRNLNELHFAQKQLNAILNAEITLHKELLEHSDFIHNPESLTNIAYSRYMLDIGAQGDYLDLLTALSACSIGYAYIGEEIAKELCAKDLSSHLYKDWILTYSCEETQKSKEEFEGFLNSYQVSQEQFKRLSQIFQTTTRLEINFWQHALEKRMD